MGAAQRAGSLDAGKRLADANSHAHGYPNSDSHGNADPNSSAGRWRLMRSGLEFHPCLLQYLHHHLQWWKHGQQERFELYSAILEPGSGPNRCRTCRSGRFRRPVVYRRRLHHWRSDAYAHSDSHAKRDPHSNSASTGQRDFRCL